VPDAAQVYFDLGHRFGMEWLRSRAAKVKTENHWQKQAVSAIIDDLYGLQSDLILGARQLGVVVVQNPTHLPFRNFYPAGDYMLLRTLVAKGVKLAFGSDGPLDPFLNLQLAVTHPVVPDEKLTLFQALTAYTAGSAFAEQLDDKGQIAPGQVADLAVLSQDLFARTPDQYVGTESILTIVGGKIAFDAGVLP